MGDFIPLARAAILAHDRLFPGHSTKDAKALDVLALALSALIPLYRREGASDVVQPLSEEEIGTGRFTRGATRLEFRDRPPLGGLMVSRRELGGALERLVRDSLVASRLGPISSRISAPRRS